MGSVLQGKKIFAANVVSIWFGIAIEDSFTGSSIEVSNDGGSTWQVGNLNTGQITYSGNYKVFVNTASGPPNLIPNTNGSGSIRVRALGETGANYVELFWERWEDQVNANTTDPVPFAWCFSYLPCVGSFYSQNVSNDGFTWSNYSAKVDTGSIVAATGRKTNETGVLTNLDPFYDLGVVGAGAHTFKQHYNSTQWSSFGFTVPLSVSCNSATPTITTSTLVSGTPTISGNGCPSGVVSLYLNASTTPFATGISVNSSGAWSVSASPITLASGDVIVAKQICPNGSGGYYGISNSSNQAVVSAVSDPAPVFAQTDTCSNTVVLNGQISGGGALPVGSIIELFAFTPPNSYALIEADVVTDATGNVSLSPNPSLVIGQLLAARSKRLMSSSGNVQTYQVSQYSLPTAVPACVTAPTVSQPEIFCPLFKGQTFVMGKVNMPAGTVVTIDGRSNESATICDNGLYQIQLTKPLELGDEVRVFVTADGSTDKVYSCKCRAGLNVCVSQMAGCNDAKVFAPNLECFKDFTECLNLQDCLTEDVYTTWTKLITNVFEAVNSSIATQGSVGGAFAVCIEAEDITLTSGFGSIFSDQAASGGKQVGDFGSDSQQRVFYVAVPQTGSYELKMRYATPVNGVQAKVYVSDILKETVTLTSTGSASGSYLESTAIVLGLNQGTNLVSIGGSGSGSTGSFRLDKICVEKI